MGGGIKVEFKEYVYSVLVVSASDAFNASLTSLLPEAKFAPIRYESSISAAKRATLERSYDFVIINSPLPDDTGLRLAIDLSGLKTTAVLLMVRAELYSSTYDKVAQHGVYILSRPTSRSTVSFALDWLVTTRERLKKFEEKTLSTEEKMQEIRIVNRAKWILIDHLKMTEPDAHRYIEKQAMDRCISKGKVAEEIVKTYS